MDGWEEVSEMSAGIATFPVNPGVNKKPVVDEIHYGKEFKFQPLWEIIQNLNFNPCGKELKISTLMGKNLKFHPLREVPTLVGRT